MRVLKAPRKVLSIAARARWLAELAQAIDEAQCLAWQLGVVEGSNAEALDLYVQLEVARAEVEALQGRRSRPELMDESDAVTRLPVGRPRLRSSPGKARSARRESRRSQRTPG